MEKAKHNLPPRVDFGRLYSYVTTDTNSSDWSWGAACSLSVHYFQNYACKDPQTKGRNKAIKCDRLLNSAGENHVHVI